MEDHRHFEELDLAIPNMDTEVLEEQAGEILRGFPGIRAVRLMSRGAWISYDGDVANADSICHSLRDAGFRASVFQDSKSGRTGQSSQ